MFKSDWTGADSRDLLFVILCVSKLDIITSYNIYSSVFPMFLLWFSNFLHDVAMFSSMIFTTCFHDLSMIPPRVSMILPGETQARPMALPAGKVHFKASEEWREVLPHHVLPNGLEVLPAPMAADPPVDEWYPIFNGKTHYFYGNVQ